MRLAIIVPVLDEAATLGAALARLAPLRAAGATVIVADGHSRDDSTGIAARHADAVVLAQRGRAAQMNAGAAHPLARAADLLLFLHADTVLPDDALAQLARALGAGAQWGRFDVRLDSTRPLLRTVGTLMNLRSRLTGICTGDQAIFCTRALFDTLGGYAPLPLMEDLDFSRRAKRRARPAALRARVLTSARRWEQHGAWRTIVLMWRLRLAWFLGADPAALAQRYRNVRGPATRVIAILARAPVPGAAKTRLIPRLGAEGAARLQARLIERACATAGAVPGAAVALWVDGPFEPLPADARALAPRVQPDADLGTRMHVALRAALQEASSGAARQAGDRAARQAGGEAARGTTGASARAAVIGTDCPALTPAAIEAAFAALDGADAAVIPAADGGYVLIALARPQPALFDGIDWGSERVMDQTRARAAASGLRLAELPMLPDLDTPADLDHALAAGWLVPADLDARAA